MTDYKKVYVLGGGTISYVRNHLALAAPAFGSTSCEIENLIRADSRYNNLELDVRLTKMANPDSDIITNEDVEKLIDEIISDASAKIVFMNMALCDFHGQIEDVESGKYAERLQTRYDEVTMHLTPQKKLISKLRENRKDIFVVGFKTTCGVKNEVMFARGLELLKGSSVNVVLANDVATKTNMIITPEEGSYVWDPTRYSRDEALEALVDMAYKRSHLSFTRSTVIDGEPVDWNGAQVYPALREVVNWCIKESAYKAFKGVTTGHFAAKLSDTEFVTSIRKTNFNDIDKNGMVMVKTDGPDNVIAMGAKPSVGGQSQRIIFDRFNEMDCIVHFHCPMKDEPRDDIKEMSQWEYECGSHQCGENTANGLTPHGNLFAVMLANHGPNIVFHHDIDPKEVIDFIQANFELSESTSGYERIYM